MNVKFDFYNSIFYSLWIKFEYNLWISFDGILTHYVRTVYIDAYKERITKNLLNKKLF